MVKKLKKRLPQHHAAAYREAAHAVVAWHRGVMLMPVSIFTRGKQVGKNVWHDPLRNVDMEWVRRSPTSALAERLAAILLAGPAAEMSLGPRVQRGSASLGRVEDAKELLGGPVDAYRRTGGRPACGDRRVESSASRARDLRGESPASRARDLRGAYPVSRAGACGRFGRVRAEVEEFLEREDVREAVEALASQLLQRGTIRGGEAASIIESFLEEPPAE